MWARSPDSHPTPMVWSPPWWGGRSSLVLTRVFAAFLTTSLVFAWFLQHFWLPASYLLGACYLLNDLRSTDTPSKNICANLVANLYIYTYAYRCIYTYPLYIDKYPCTYTHDLYIYIYVMHVYDHICHIYAIYIYTYICMYQCMLYIYIYVIHVSYTCYMYIHV